MNNMNNKNLTEEQWKKRKARHKRYRILHKNIEKSFKSDQFYRKCA